MRLACSPVLCPDYTVDGFAELAASAGYARIELFRDRTESTPVHDDFSVPAVRHVLRQKSIDVAAFHIRRLTGRKADSDERNLAYNLRQLEWDIHLGRALGVERFVVSGGEATDEVRDDFVEGIGQLAERLPEASLTVGNLAHSPLSDAEDFATLLPRLPDAVGIWLDLGELTDAGADVAKCVDVVGERLVAVRLRDPRAADGNGAACLEDLLPQLRRIDFDGDLIVCLDAVAETLRARLAAAAHSHLTALIDQLPDGEQ